MTIKQYATITARGDTELVDAVNRYIREGWQPLGGPAFAAAKDQTGAEYGTLIQAMVRHAKTLIDGLGPGKAGEIGLGGGPYADVGSMGDAKE